MDSGKWLVKESFEKCEGGLWMVQKIHGKTISSVVEKGDPTANVWMDCLTPEKMKQYFKL